MITVREFLNLHSILMAVVESELGQPALFPDVVKDVLDQKDGDTERPIPDPVLRWLGLLDLAVNPHLLRKHMKDQTEVDEATIRAFLRFLVSRQPRSQSDRDKVDWLATYLFQAREERTKKPTGWPKTEVQEILQGIPFPHLSEEAGELLGEVSSLLEEIKYFEKFSQITDSRIIQRGRELKNRFGEDFFHPDVLIPIINYNLVFGKKFHGLLQETMQKVQESASRQTESGGPDAQELLRTDYRATADAFRHLTELGRERGPAKAAAGSAASRNRPGPSDPEGAGELSEAKERMRELGIDIAVEERNLQRRTGELKVLVKAHPVLSSLPGAWAPLPLQEWESNAFRTDYSGSEQSFRVEFARQVSRAIAILSLIDEELPAYHGKKGTEFLWKKHYDTLLYLFQEGRWHKERLTRLAADSEGKGLTGKAKQLLQTAAKLEAGLAKAEAIF